MQLRKVLNRIISNIIDIFTFILGFSLLKYLTTINENVEASYFLILTTYLILFLPILIIKGQTIGKMIMNLNFQKSSNNIIALKYSIYFLAFFPGFSIISLFFNFPYFRLKNYDTAVSVQILITLIIADSIIFLCSVGKYHLLDYLLNIKIIGLEFRKNALKSLSIALLFWTILIFLNLAFLKKQLNVKNVHNSFSKEVYSENFPEDLFYGSKVFIIKTKSDAVFIPTDMFSFLFKKEYDQKLLYLTLPYEVFHSKEDRLAICNQLVYYSGINDIFNGYSPKQNKITLRTVRQDNLSRYYNYSYTYYYNGSNGLWGIYAGIENDSTMIDSYTKFITDLTSDSSGKLSLMSEYCNDNIIISCKNAKLQFNVIPFESAVMKGSFQFNFPPQSSTYLGNYWNLIDGAKTDYYEEDMFYLKFCRDEISAKTL